MQLVNIDWIGAGYLIAFLVGVVFSAVTVLMGGLLDIGDGGGELGGGVEVSHDFGAGGEGHGAGFATETADVTGVSPYSPMMIALFLTCFGGVGYLLHKLVRASIWGSLPIATVSGFLIAFAIFTVFVRIAKSIQASSEPTRAGLAGLQAEVLVGIDANSVGEIAYITRGSRFTAPARTEDGTPVGVREVVRIVRYVGGTAIVRRETEKEAKAKPRVSPDNGGE